MIIDVVRYDQIYIPNGDHNQKQYLHSASTTDYHIILLCISCPFARDVSMEINKLKTKQITFESPDAAHGSFKEMDKLLAFLMKSSACACSCACAFVRVYLGS